MLQRNLPSLIISVIRREGAVHLLSLNRAFIQLTHKPPLHHSISHMASVWACIKQKPRNLRQVSEQGRTLSSLQPPTPTRLLYTHPARWPPPPYAKNYHTSFSLYPYSNMMEKNWAFIWGGGCVFIQQRQHQETRESPHCCWWRQERVGDWRAGRRGEWRLGERGERNSLNDSHLGTWTFYDFPPFGKKCRLLGIALGTKSKTPFTIKRGVCVRVCVHVGVCERQRVS